MFSESCSTIIVARSFIIAKLVVDPDLAVSLLCNLRYSTRIGTYVGMYSGD